MRIRKMNQPEFILMEKDRTAVNHPRFVHRSWKLNCPWDVLGNFPETTSVQKASDAAKTESQCGRRSNNVENIKEGKPVFPDENKQGNDSGKQPSVINQPSFIHLKDTQEIVSVIIEELDNVKNPRPQNSRTDDINPKVCNLIGIDAFSSGPPACNGNGRKKSHHQHESVGINRKTLV